MKTNTIIFILLIVATISCKAQVVGLDASLNEPDGTYYKDLNSELDKFIGTWTYTNGNTVLTIILEKKENKFIDGHYLDLLVGEYLFINNGVEIVNTLSNLSNDQAEKNIEGSYIHYKNDYPTCADCSDDERRIDMNFNDPERSYLVDSIVVRYLLGETNPEKLEVVIYQSGGGILPEEDSPDKPRVPYGTYIMEKQ